MEIGRKKLLLETVEDLINKLALFNGLCLVIYDSNELTIDERIDSLLIDLNELLDELNKAG